MAAAAVATISLAGFEGRLAARVIGLQDDVDHTRDRIRAILCRGTVAQHFDTLDCARRNEVEIDRVAALRRRARVEVDDRAVVTALAVDKHEDMEDRKSTRLNSST